MNKHRLKFKKDGERAAKLPRGIDLSPENADLLLDPMDSSGADVKANWVDAVRARQNKSATEPKQVRRLLARGNPLVLDGK